MPLELHHQILRRNLRKTKHDLQTALGVDGLPIAPRGREVDLLGGPHCSLIQAITKPLNDSQHMHLSAGCELDVQFHIAFDNRET